MTTHDRRFAYRVAEGEAGIDLDGDGELTHDVLHVFDARQGVATNTRQSVLAGPSIGARHVVYLDYLTGSVPGPLAPQSIHLYDLRARTARDLGLTASDFRLQDERIVVLTREDWQGVDLNGNGGRGDVVIQVHDLRTGHTQNTRVAFDYNLPVGPLALEGKKLVIELGFDRRLWAIRLR